MSKDLHDVDPALLDVATFGMLQSSTPEVEPLPVQPSQWAWLIDRVATAVAAAIKEIPSGFDLQIASNVLARVELETPKIWTSYPPWLAMKVVEPLVYRFRVLMAETGKVLKYAKAIHARYERVVRGDDVPVGGDALFEWPVVGGINDVVDLRK